ncbi:MAG: hypothetical protein ACXIT4_13365 [Erythrobacter sp.]
MPAHQPIPPNKAIELVEAKKLDGAKFLLADFAAAGLVKTYALVREIRPIDDPVEIIRDCQLPTEDWHRIVASASVDAALSGGTVRLEGSSLRGGPPSILITGVSFSETSLTKVLERYCADPSGGAPKPYSEEYVSEPDHAYTQPSHDRKFARKTVPPIKKGALTASVAQAMQATGLGRTKIDQLMRNGDLVRTKVGKRTLITVESIERLVGTKVAR